MLKRYLKSSARKATTQLHLGPPDHINLRTAEYLVKHAILETKNAEVFALCCINASACL